MSEAAQHPVVRLSRGQSVRGAAEGGVSVFRGIPYAAPAVGAARFAAPTRAAVWDGVRDASQFGPPPAQYANTPTAPPAPTSLDPSEWFTLNVWTPDHAARDLPVLVWIYGGAFRMGHAGEGSYDGAALAAKGAVVVTANYRVGVEGFASLESVPANRALLDQVAFLTWVQDEIRAFGGDASRVTVFGESAGGVSVAALLAMPSARGLFSRALASSPAGVFYTPELAREVTAELLAPLGVPATLDAVAGVSPEALAGAVGDLDSRMPGLGARWGTAAMMLTPFAIVVDGDVLPEDPWTALASGAARDVPFVVGHNRDEYRLFHVLGGMLGQTSDDFATAVISGFGPQPDALDRVEAAYGDVGLEERMIRVQSDRVFRIPAYRLAEAHAAGGGDAYLYELAWPAPGSGGVFGAAHGLDVPLQFGTLDKDLAVPLIGVPTPPEAVRLSSEIQDAWLRFAVTDDPGWPAFTPAEQTTRVFDVDGGVVRYPEQAALSLWAGESIGRYDVTP